MALRLNPSGLRRKKNPSLRELRYATAVGSLGLGAIAYVMTHRAGPVIASVVAGMVVTPIVFGASGKQLKQILFHGTLNK